MLNIHFQILNMSNPATGRVCTLKSGFGSLGDRYIQGFIVINNTRIPMTFHIQSDGIINYMYSSTQIATQL